MIKNGHAVSHGIQLKKKYGQHFLRDQSVIDTILNNATLDESTSVFEIGCGDGFLTRGILSKKIARLWVFEIDPDWVTHIGKTISDKRMTVHTDNILDIDFSIFESHKPWTLLANLPYQVTFPILHKLQENKHLLREGVIMIQEEVAQKIVKTGGRGYGFQTLFFQHHFNWKLLTKVKPGAFLPPPKVDSRLLYFKPRTDAPVIPDEERFWKFIKLCLRQPRRTLRNNLAQTHFDISDVPEETLLKRAQQLHMDDFLAMWQLIK